MKTTLYAHAAALQSALLAHHARGGLDSAPRVLLDAWASLEAWHRHGERVWRISRAAAEETADMILPHDLPLATTRTRGHAVAYQLPERSEWIVLARHAPAPGVVTVRGPDVGWAYAQPLLTYATEIQGRLCAGYYSLADYPTAGSLPDLIRPGHAYRAAGSPRALGAAETAEESARVALALLHHYLP